MITIPVDTFSRAMSICQPFVPSRTTKDELRYIKMECDSEFLTLVASDGEAAIRHSEALAGQVGSVMLPGRLSLVLSESNSDDVGLDMEPSGVLIVHDGDNEYRLMTIPVKDYPTREFANAKEGAIEVHRGSFLAGLSLAAIAADESGSRYVLDGVRVEYENGVLHFVGTDSRRASIVELRAVGDTAMQCIVPQSHVKRLVTSLSAVNSQYVYISNSSNKIEFLAEQTSISCPVQSGLFPQWRKIVPKETSSPAVVQSGHLASTIRQARLGRQEEETAVRFAFEAGQLTLGSGTDKHGSKVELPISYEGPKVVVNLNPEYVLGWLGKLKPEDTTEWRLTDGESPVLATCAARGAKYVIMPLSEK